MNIYKIIFWVILSLIIITIIVYNFYPVVSSPTDPNISIRDRIEKDISQCKEGDILDLDYVTSAKNLDLSKVICSEISLNGLTSTEGLVFPNAIGKLFLNSLTSTNNLVLPETVGRLYLNGIISDKNILFSNLPFIRSLELNGLTSTKNIIFPKYFNYLSLNGITSTENLVLPETVRILNLDGLISAEGLTIPNVWYLSLNGLTSIKGLVLPEYITSLSVNNLTSEQKTKLLKNNPQFTGEILKTTIDIQ